MMPQSRCNVLIIAPYNDTHALTVYKRLEEMGACPLFLDSALFPGECSLTMHFEDGKVKHLLKAGEYSLYSDDIRGVWWRRPKQHRVPSRFSGSEIGKFIRSESRHVFDGWLQILGNKVINPIAADDLAGYKPYQLDIAMQVGLNVPKTLITNDPVEVVSKFESGDSIIYKTLTGGVTQTLETRRFSNVNLEHIGNVTNSPVIFQNELKNKIDIRVTIIDTHLFSISIHPKKDKTMLDWRMDLSADYKACSIPEEVQGKLFQLMKKLCLRFGAIDLVLSNGEYYFLEINPGGQWLFAEIFANQSISIAMAKALYNP